MNVYVYITRNGNKQELHTRVNFPSIAQKVRESYEYSNNTYLCLWKTSDSGHSLAQIFLKI